MTIWQRIKKILDNHGMTQKELAEKAGVTEGKQRMKEFLSEHWILLFALFIYVMGF